MKGEYKCCIFSPKNKATAAQYSQADTPCAHNDYLLVVSQYQRSRCALVNQIPNLLLHSGVSLRGDSFKGLDNNTPWGC